MDSFLEKPKGEGGNLKIMIGAIAIGVIVVGLGIWLISLRPSAVDIEAQALDGAIREGNPEYDKYGKRVILATDEDRLMKSPTALGDVMMTVGGRVKNLTGKKITALEVKLTLIDMAGKDIIDKTFLVVPRNAAEIEDRGEIPITVTLNGIDKESSPANFRWKVTAIKVE